MKQCSGYLFLEQKLWKAIKPGVEQVRGGIHDRRCLGYSRW